jgi:AAA+ superfamily predicted ATPase
LTYHQPFEGAPGVGKTCTAECIAELVKKPLYPITCGDLGSTAEDVEKGLKKHFMLASKWDCVMLLDEADVFLARRKPEDLHRNSIVSVFLRMLEYYKGLLFLTTNRVGSFDEAFKSRVHISLFCECSILMGPITTPNVTSRPKLR